MVFPGFIGQKVGMTQIFDDNGQALPVTVIELCPLTVTQLKTPANDGYAAVQVGYQNAKEKHLTKAEIGHLKKAQLDKTQAAENTGLVRRLKEFRVSDSDLAQYTLGSAIDPFVDGSFLSAGSKVDVSGLSIGKGFQGNTKRWNHHRGPMSHGSKSHRLPGSIGAGTTPSRVFKGLRMAGRMGHKQVTTQQLQVVRVIPEKRVVLIHGSVPGVEGTFITIRPSLGLKRRAL